jgi:DNA-binding NarL/FixJ family response regulator
VLAALREGLSNARIASRLGISVPTVKTHVSSILVKLGADSRAHAAALARELPL